MATFKTTSGDYTVNLGPYLPPSGNLAARWAGTMTINGNLNVAGNITYVEDIAVNDAFIVVAANNTGTVTDMGLVATKNANTGSYAGLRFDSTANAWQISSSVNFDGSPVAAYANLTSGGSVAGSNTQIQFNDNGSFGASANLTYDYSSNRLTLAGHQVFGNQSLPVNVANSVVLYSNVVAGGGTGLYFTSVAAADELVSKSKAIVFALIL